MKLINALKTVCDFLLLISFAALIPSYGNARPLIVLLLSLAFVSALILQSIPDSMPLRIVCALIPALSLFAAHSTAQIIITTVIILFYVLIAVEEKIEMHYDDYKYWYAIPAVPVIVLFAVTTSYWPIRSTASVCAGFYLFLGILVLRRKRIGSKATASIKAVNLVELLGVLVFDAVACLVVRSVVMAVKDYLVLLLTPLAMIFHVPAYIVSVVTDKLYLWFVSSNLDEQKEEETAKEVWAQFHNQGAPPTFHGKTGDEWAYMIVSVVLVITVVILLIMLLYSFFKMLGYISSETAGKDDIESGQAEAFHFGFNRRRKRKHGPAKTNNDKIRQIYADYLFFMKAYGVKIGRQSTSEEVMVDSLKLVEPEKARELREIYLRARYNDADELSDDEVQQAREIYKFITETIEANK